MKNKKRIGLLLLMAMAALLLLAACGGSGGGDGGGSLLGDAGGSNATSSAAGNSSGSGNIQPSGGDASGSGSLQPSSGTGNDARYVADICKSAKTYLEDFTAAFGKIDPSNPKAFTDALAKPMRSFAQDFARAKPPQDLKAWHDETVARFNGVVKALERGDANAFSADGPQFPQMPAEASARLQQLAQDNKDCQALQQAGGSIFN